MGVKTREEYFESIRKQQPDVYIRGEKATAIADHLLCWTGINSVAVTYDISNVEGTSEIQRLVISRHL